MNRRSGLRAPYVCIYVCVNGEQYDKARQELMQSELRRMMNQKLSDNLYESF